MLRRKGGHGRDLESGFAGAGPQGFLGKAEFVLGAPVGVLLKSLIGTMGSRPSKTWLLAQGYWAYGNCTCGS